MFRWLKRTLGATFRERTRAEKVEDRTMLLEVEGLGDDEAAKQAAASLRAEPDAPPEDTRRRPGGVG